MRAKKFIVLFTALLFCLASNAVLAYEATSGPTGVIKWDQTKADNSFTLFDAGNKTYLVHPGGYLLYEWEWEEAGTTELLENGHLLRHEPAEGGSIPNLIWGGESGKISEYDWNGNLIWSYFINSENEISHHWITAKGIDKTLVVVWERISYADAVAAGRDSATLSDSQDPAVNCYR